MYGFILSKPEPATYSELQDTKRCQRSSNSGEESDYWKSNRKMTYARLPFVPVSNDAFNSLTVPAISSSIHLPFLRYFPRAKLDNKKCGRNSDRKLCFISDVWEGGPFRPQAHFRNRKSAGDCPCQSDCCTNVIWLWGQGHLLLATFRGNSAWVDTGGGKCA